MGICRMHARRSENLRTGNTRRNCLDAYKQGAEFVFMRVEKHAQGSVRAAISPSDLDFRAARNDEILCRR
eukprot:6205940-Pleurochrysis_carterae.AAC.1